MATEGKPTDRTTLCITRKNRQVVWIGTTRVEIEGATVKLHITAQRSITILRDEVLPRH